MASVHWTGNPFVDAGLAALATAAQIGRLEAITGESLDQAVQKLEQVLLSDQSLGIGVEKSFARSPLSQVFPNSELVNPSNWKGKTAGEKAASVRTKFHKAIATDLQRACRCLEGADGREVCSVCGAVRPIEAMVMVRKDKMPLLEGMVNFYPAFAYGVQLCGLCALAVRFLPLSIMRMGAGNRLWFLHTQAFEMATAIAQAYGWEHLNSCIARNETVDFFGDWETAGPAGTVLYLLFTLLERFGHQLRSLYQNPRPTTAYLFSNRNERGFVQALSVPHELMRFLQLLQIRSLSAYGRFWRELLQLPKNLQGKQRDARRGFVSFMGQQIMEGSHLIASCLDHEAPLLRGGWVGHALYLQEVRKMAQEALAILQQLGLTIAQSENAKRTAHELRTATWTDVYSLLLGFVRRGWLRHEEYYTILPPNDYGAAHEIRDVLLAVIYEWQRCQTRGEEFPQVEFELTERPPEQTLARIQQIGQGLVEQLPNLSRWVSRLQTARRPDRIRGAYLNAVQHGAMRFDGFIFMAPLGDMQQHWLLRDYLLAFLFDRGREILAMQEVEETTA
ncbi:MAG TPA: type I-B CRISPR-associated protein Cas8b1/Cst1 [Alphaproteobacteria bacterium]|nr:type I-B CRISPR-associated protein Cas8b1/Cst1 [Alphaproteobacteria bacterium]